jgi:hypothetical protein
MTQAEIYRYVNALWNTDSMGGALNLKEHNDAQKEVNLTMFNDAIAELSQSPQSTELIYSSKMLRQFIAPYIAVPVVGIVTLATLTNYAQFLKMYTTSAYQGQIREIKLVDHQDLTNRMSNLMRTPLKYNPVCTIDNQASIKILPNDIASVTIYYLKYPATPIFDYYVDANDVVQPLAVGATRALAAGETGSSGQITPVTVTSTTIELEWGAETHWQFVNLLLKRLGLANDDQLKFQASSVEEQTLAVK